MTQEASTESGKSSDTESDKNRVFAHPNSILSRLESLPADQRAKFYANKEQAEGDAAAMERWAATGYTSEGETDEDDQYYPELD